jgi:hypothetical protein
MVLFDAEGDGTLDGGMYLPWNPNIGYKNLPRWIFGSYQRNEPLGTLLKAIILGWDSYTSDVEEDVRKVSEPFLLWRVALMF